ncbi:MAG: AAA family ATPase [Thermoplasmatota archaeon]
MKKERKRTKLHTDDKIILLISEFSSRRGQWDAPYELTQAGMAEKLSMLENNISRSLKRLLKEGTVEKELRHVKGEKRRKNAYFLTRQGETAADQIREGLSERPVICRLDGKEIRMPMTRVVAECRSRGVAASLLDMYLNIDSGGEPVIIAEARGFTDISPKLVGRFSLPRHFFGREDELLVIDKFLKSDAGVLLIRGIAGVGKTTLILHAMTMHRARAGYIRCEPWTDPVELMNEIEFITGELGMDFEASVAEPAGPSPGMIIRALQNASGPGLVLIIDDLQKTRGGLDLYLEAMCKASMDRSGLKIVILSRETPPFIDPRYEIHGDVISIDLEGLGQDAIAELIGAKGRKGDHIQLWEMTRGHPLFIEIAMTSSDMDPGSRFGDFLEKEVIAPLPPIQRRCLQKASVCGLQAHISLFEGAEREDLDGLKAKGLLRETAPSIFSVHDLISDHVMNDMAGVERDEIEAGVLSYLTAAVLRLWGDGPELVIGIRDMEEDWDDDRKLVDISDYSSIRYEDQDHLREQIRDYIDACVSLHVNRGLVDEAAGLIAILAGSARKGKGRILFRSMNVLRGLLNDEDRMDMLLLQGNIEVQEEEWDLAEKTIERIENTMPAGLIKGRRKGDLEHIRSMVSRQRMRFDETVRSHKSAIETYRKIGDGASTARERLHLSRTLMRMGESEGSLKEALKTASEYAEIPDRYGESHACIQGYRAARAAGKHAAARKLIDRARKLAGSLDNHRLMALVELEEMISGDGDPSDNIERFDEVVGESTADDVQWAVQGYLRMSRSLEGSKGRIRLRIRCLASARHLLSAENDRSASKTVIAADSFEPDMVDSGIDLLEQSLSLFDILEKRNMRKVRESAENSGWPFVKVREKDPKGSVLKQLSIMYEDRIRALPEVGTGSDMPTGLMDNYYEDLVHNLIELAIHYHKRDRLKSAKACYKRCGVIIAEYEWRMSELPDHTPSWNLRKAKEILNNNRALITE